MANSYRLNMKLLCVHYIFYICMKLKDINVFNKYVKSFIIYNKFYPQGPKLGLDILRNIFSNTLDECFLYGSKSISSSSYKI